MEVDSVVCMGTGEEVDIAVDLRMVVELSGFLSWIQGLGLSRPGMGSGDVAQFGTVVAAGTA